MQQEEGHLEEVKILAEYAVDMCKHVWGSELDYELNSLTSVDEAIEELRGYEHADQKAITFFLVALACYLGEVIIRNHDAVWLDDVDSNGMPVGLKAGNVTTSPFRKVFRRYRESTEHDILHYAVCAIALSSTFQEFPASRRMNETIPGSSKPS